MRPDTLAEAVARIQRGAPQDVMLAEFFDTFDLASTSELRYITLVGEPALTNEKRLDALVGAVVEYLAKQHRLDRVTSWTSGPMRCLDSPWHISSIFIDWKREVMTDAMREYLTFSSPAEFASRNIFTEERPLRRSLGPQPAGK